MQELDEARFLIGGAQGTGLETAAQVLTTAYAAQGYRVYSFREYYSNIKGRHSYIGVRVSSEAQPAAPRASYHIIAAIDAESVFMHLDDADKDTFFLYNADLESRRLSGLPVIEEETKKYIGGTLARSGYGDSLSEAIRYIREVKGARLVPVSFNKVLTMFAESRGIKAFAARRYANTILIAAIALMTGLGLDKLRRGFERRFANRPRVVEDNMALAGIVAKELEQYRNLVPIRRPKHKPRRLMVLSGNDAVAMGKVVAGMRFQSYYPITPAQDESFMLESIENLETSQGQLGGVVVLQTEDEIAAITAAIGAALAGARAATATSGPGFDLMVEALGWAGINEVPVVITLYQRGGPSTGLPTRGQQADLLDALFASHGEFPRIVIASGDHEEAFRDAVLAFNLAERYQTPVIHILDKFIANSIATVEPPTPESLEIDRGALVENPGKDYKRFSLEHPISPRVFLGTHGTVVWYTGDEHNEVGHISEDKVNRRLMYEKRMKKLEIAAREIPEEERAILYGDGGDFLLIGWGSVKGAAIEALKVLRDKGGLNGAYLHIRMMEPFPARYVSKIIEEYGVSRVIDVENNYTGQLARVVAMNAGHIVRRRVLKWTGRPIYVDELVHAVPRVLGGEKEVEVLEYGI